MDKCPSCHYRLRDGRCQNRRCPEFQPCDPEVRAAALASIRADARQGLAALRSRERTIR